MRQAEHNQLDSSSPEAALSILAEAGVGAAFLDNSGRVVSSNAAFESWLGASATSLRQTMFLDVLPSEMAASAADDFNRLLLGQVGRFSFEGWLAGSDGSHRRVRVSVSALTDPGSAYALLTAVELGSETDDRAWARAFRAALNATNDPIIVCRPDGRVCFVNRAFETETGYTTEEVAGSELNALFGSADGAEGADLWKSVSAGGHWRGKLALRSRRDPLPAQTTVSFSVADERGNVEHIVTAKRYASDTARYEERLARLAQTDPVTGLPNRLLFGDQVNRKLAEARRYGTQIAVMYIDLDRFKAINETLGHTNGDLLLRAVAERITATLREVDMVARMGADEFTALLVNIRTPAEAVRVAERLYEALSAPFSLAGREIFVSASIGISRSPDDGSDVETLVKNADAAMRSAKARGRNTFEFYNTAHNASAMERMTIEHKLPRALERGEFVLYYQPCQDLRTDQIVGSEALIRWLDPELGLVSPGVFIPVAEDTGLIVPITEFVLREACARNKDWANRGLGPLEVAVNISSRMFQLRTFPDTLRSTLAEIGLDPQYLVLELTEYLLMRDPEAATEVLRDMKETGVRLAVDDFGTGYSSLSYLKNFPIDTLKIDRSFVSGIPGNSSDAAIAEAVIAMAHSLHMEVIAEGVETIEQLEFLRDRGCDRMQGYFISQPALPEDFEALVTRREAAATAAKVSKAA